MSIYYSILYFFVYGFLGWCTEVIFAAFKQHRFVNRGFLNGPICPIYGVGVTLVIACLEAFQSNLLLLYISSVILVTVLEGNGQAVPQQMVGLFQTAFQYRRVCLPFIFLDLGRCMRFHRVFCPPADPSGVIPDSAHSRNCFDRNPWHCSAFRYDRNHFCNREVQSISGTAEAYHRRITRNFQSDRSRALSECNARTGYAGKFQTKTG
jgi:hypothetical protein